MKVLTLLSIVAIAFAGVFDKLKDDLRSAGKEIKDFIDGAIDDTLKSSLFQEAAEFLREEISNHSGGSKYRGLDYLKNMAENYENLQLEFELRVISSFFNLIFMINKY